MNSYNRPLVFAFLIVGALFAGVGSGQPAGRFPALTIPRPDLSAMEATAREKIESMQASLETLKQREDIQPTELAEAFGHLGQLFHAYRLLDSAEESYSISGRLSPEDYRWLYYLALVQHAEGELATAITNYESALAQHADDPAILLRLGDALVEVDRTAEARQRFERVRELEPDSAAAYYGLGKVAGFDNEFQTAVAHFERVLELQPDASVVHYLLGQAYRKIGELDKAREHLQKRGQEEVLFTDPLGDQVARLAKGTAFEIVLALAESADDYSDEEFLGFALSHFGDVRGSIKQLEQGLNLKQDADASADEQSRIHYVLGGLLVNDGRDTEAIVHFKRALELAPELTDARVKLGNAQARAGNYEAAVTAYDSVVASQPQNATALLKRVSALMALGREPAARKDLEKLLTLSPESSEVHVRLASLLEKNNELESAINLYLKVLDLEVSLQEKPLVHYRLATLLRQVGRFDQAIEQYKAALEVEPTLAPALNNLGGLLAQVGNMSDAAKVFGALVRLAPEQLQPRLAESTALILSGQYAAATTRLEEALAKFPDELPIKDILARHLAAAPDQAVRNGSRAVELALDLFDNVPSPESAETLAMAYAEAGRFEDALKWQRQLIAELVPDSDPELAKRLAANLTLYERGEPCCAEAEN